MIKPSFDGFFAYYEMKGITLLLAQIKGLVIPWCVVTTYGGIKWEDG